MQRSKVSASRRAPTHQLSILQLQQTRLFPVAQVVRLGQYAKIRPVERSFALQHLFHHVQRQTVVTLENGRIAAMHVPKLWVLLRVMLGHHESAWDLHHVLL